MAKKEEVAEVLEIILDGLTAGESSEKKLEETKKFYTDELTKVDTEKQFYERVIRFCLLERYALLEESVIGRFTPPEGSKLFYHQAQANAIYNSKPIGGLGFSLDDFNKFVDDYLNTARNDKIIGIKEDKNEETLSDSRL